jgi:hypothetical protein
MARGRVHARLCRCTLQSSSSVTTTATILKYSQQLLQQRKKAKSVGNTGDYANSVNLINRKLVINVQDADDS